MMRTIIVAALGAFGGTLGYAYILNAPKNTILPASFIGLAGYMAYVLLGMAGFGTMSAYFLSTVLVSVVCELLARKMRTPATIFLLSALVPTLLKSVQDSYIPVKLASERALLHLLQIHENPAVLENYLQSVSPIDAKYLKTYVQRVLIKLPKSAEDDLGDL